MRTGSATFGLTDDQWQEATEQVREAILAAARDRRMTSYSEVAAQVTVVRLEPHSALMSHLLGTVLQEEHQAQRPLLTALVTHKQGDMEPGKGFYEMARTLGYSVPDPLLFWAEQVQNVFKHYGAQRR